MGYMGFGLQRWIYTMKPRKPFQKGNKNPGYESVEFLNPQEFRPSTITTTDPKILEERIKASKKRIALRVRVGRIYSVLIIAGILGLGVLVYQSISDYMPIFQENHNAVVRLNTIEEENALSVLIESGMLNMRKNEIENAIEDFKLALTIDPENRLALYNITLAFSFDCELNTRNCNETFEYFERLKKLDKGLISEELEIRMVIIEEKLRTN